jgi:hypothetical protein
MRRYYDGNEEVGKRKINNYEDDINIIRKKKDGRGV